MNRLTVLLWRFRAWVAGAIVPRRTVESRGLQFSLPCDNWITYYRWHTYNSKEPETLDWLDRQLKPGGTFFDVGANIGIYSLYAALRHKSVKVVAFEPEYANLHVLRDNVIQNQLHDTVEMYSIALGGASGPSHLYIQDVTPGAALHSVSDDRLSVTHAQRTVVAREGIWVSTLDSFCERTGLVPDCIKIDVDGTELAILEGGRKTFGTPSLRSVLIERSPDEAVYQACAKLLLEAGLTREWYSKASPNEIWGRP